MKRVIFVFLILIFCLVSVSFAYEEAEVKNGGSIEGMVTFAGVVIPIDKVLTISSDTKYCGDALAAEKYLIAPNRSIKNVVVYIDNIGKGKPVPDTPVHVDNSKCAFIPHVSVGFERKEVVIKNSDPIFHNVHTYLRDRTMYNLGLPEQGSEVTKRFRKTGIMEITCDAHPWMHGYTYILDHPYAEVTNEKGAFVLTDIPPGEYTVRAWHEALGNIQIADIKVESGKASKMEIKLTDLKAEAGETGKLKLKLASVEVGAGGTGN